jgi:hypothetical protein
LNIKTVRILYCTLSIVYGVLMCFFRIYGGPPKFNYKYFLLAATLILVCSFALFSESRKNFYVGWVGIAMVQIILSNVLRVGHQINTMFGIIAVILAMTRQKPDLFLLLSRFSVFIGYFFSGINKLVSPNFINGSIMKPFIERQSHWLTLDNFEFKAVVLSVPLIEIILAFVVLCGFRRTWIIILMFHILIGFFLANGFAHFMELCVFGSLMLFGSFPIRERGFSSKISQTRPNS